MLNSLTTFGTSSSGIGALGFDGKAFLIQLITFVIALLVLRKYAFKPIVKILRERRDLIESGVRIGEEMKKSEVELEAKVEQTLHEARQTADEIIAGAQETGRQTVREAEDKARDKAAEILTDAESRIVSDTARARQALEKELVNLISDATEVIIDEKVDAKKDAQLIEKALKGRVSA